MSFLDKLIKKEDKKSVKKKTDSLTVKQAKPKAEKIEEAASSAALKLKENQPILKEKSKEPEIKKTSKEDTKDAYRILLKPLVTEKATFLGKENKYCFAVAIFADKRQIKEAIYSLYGKKPLAVNIVRNLGKEVRTGRTIGKKKDWKKAIITLKPGEKIEIYEGV